MKWKIADPQTCLNLISVMILLVGLGSAVFIYRIAENDSNSVFGYEIIGGQAYPIMPEDSKMYLRDLQLYSGKAGVLADEFRRWFVGLWQGKSLAVIIGCATLMISFGFFYAANYLTSDFKSDVYHENNPDRTG